MMMYILCVSNYYLCDFLEIIDIKKIRENDGVDDDVHILHVNRYTISTCGELGM
jgi:hypothetical protein